jgi:hypothetical protein
MILTVVDLVVIDVIKGLENLVPLLVTSLRLSFTLQVPHILLTVNVISHERKRDNSAQKQRRQQNGCQRLPCDPYSRRVFNIRILSLLSSFQLTVLSSDLFFVILKFPVLGVVELSIFIKMKLGIHGKLLDAIFGVTL